MSERRSSRPRWFCGAYLSLSFGCFAASFVLSLAERDNALAFGFFGLILALWGSLLAGPHGVRAKDVNELLKSINPLSKK